MKNKAPTSFNVRNVMFRIRRVRQAVARQVETLLELSERLEREREHADIDSSCQGLKEGNDNALYYVEKTLQAA